jgi:hypothetical protein
MITGMGIPNSQSIRPLPIFHFPTLFPIPKKMQQHNDDKSGISHSAAATIVSLHLAVANEMGAPWVPVGKEGAHKGG